MGYLKTHAYIEFIKIISTGDKLYKYKDRFKHYGEHYLYEFEIDYLL